MFGLKDQMNPEDINYLHSLLVKNVIYIFILKKKSKTTLTVSPLQFLDNYPNSQNSL